MILLDTQVLVWSALGDARLGENCRQLLRSAEGGREFYMCPISAWEIAMLADKGRLRLNLPTHDWIAYATEQHDVRWTKMTPVIAATAGHLPGKLHGDPADRLIIATAKSLESTLLTADRKILAYAAAGHVQAIDARY